MAQRSIRNVGTVTIIVGIAALALTFGFGLINGLSDGGAPLGIDNWWMGMVAAEVLAPWTLPSIVLDEIGSGVPAFVIAAVITVALLLWRRPWGAVYFVAAAMVSTAVVEVMKNTIARPRPTDALIDVGFGSYPSGHSARAAMIAVALGVLLPRVWMWILGAVYALAMMFSRTQLGAHWLTDTIAGALVGGAVALLCFALVARRLIEENERGRPQPWGSRG